MGVGDVRRHMSTCFHYKRPFCVKLMGYHEMKIIRLGLLENFSGDKWVTLCGDFRFYFSKIRQNLRNLEVEVLSVKKSVTTGVMGQF